VAQCLARDAQFRARSLQLEVLGLQALAQRDQNVVRLYLTGVHRPALEVLQTTPDGEERTYPLGYLLGHCLLALNQPEAARQAFAAALQRCDRQLHRAVLRRLASDVDQVYLSVARRAVLDHLEAGAYEEALRAAAEVIVRLRKPEAGFLDLARVHYETAAARLGQGRQPLARPASLVVPAWRQALEAVYAADSDLGRARGLVRLGRQAGPDAARPADLLDSKIEALAAQEAVATALVQSGELLKQGRFDAALAILDNGDAALGREPRVQRQRALLLLKLERFEEADAVADALGQARTPGTAEFLATYPALAFRQRLAVAVRLIRAGSDDQAARLLAGARAKTADETLELGYCRAFCGTMAGYRYRRQGQKAPARQAFEEALREVERHLAAARAAGHARLLELYATLEDALGGETWE
jgi:hypothetical protein